MNDDEFGLCILLKAVIKNNVLRGQATVINNGLSDANLERGVFCEALILKGS